MRLIILPQALKISIPGISERWPSDCSRIPTLVSINFDVPDLVGMIRGPNPSPYGLERRLLGTLGDLPALLFFVVCLRPSRNIQMAGTSNSRPTNH